MPILPLPDRPAWNELWAHCDQQEDVHLRDLFKRDRHRGAKMALDDVGIYFDYSKNRVTDETLRLLFRLAEESGLTERKRAMFAGEHINTTEDRPVLHVALRAPRESPVYEQAVLRQVHAVLGRMEEFAKRIRNKQWLGYGENKPIIKNIINIGIGGSDLGPV